MVAECEDSQKLVRDKQDSLKLVKETAAENERKIERQMQGKLVGAKG